MDARLIFVQAFNHLRVPFSFVKGSKGGQVTRKIVFLETTQQLNTGLRLLKHSVAPGTHKGVPIHETLASEIYAAWHKKGAARRKRTEILKLAYSSNTS